MHQYSNRPRPPPNPEAQDLVLSAPADHRRSDAGSGAVEVMPKDRDTAGTRRQPSVSHPEAPPIRRCDPFTGHSSARTTSLLRSFVVI
jgi:hypothetical protein